MKTIRKEIALSDARAQLGLLVNEVRFGVARIVLTSHGRVVGAIINAADLEELEEFDSLDMAGILKKKRLKTETERVIVRTTMGKLGGKPLAPGAKRPGRRDRSVAATSKNAKR